MAASSLAIDDQDGSDQTAAQKTVYFANSTTDLAFTANNTTNVYTTSACSTKVTDYIGIKFTSNTSLTLTFNKLPRAGTSGYTMSNNSMTVYVVLRDNYNTSTPSQCGKVVSSIVINFKKQTISHGSNTAGIATNGNTYRFGDGSTMDATKVASGGIYSKTQAGRFALTVEKPVKRGDSVVVTTSGLLTGYDSAKYKVLMVPGTVPSGAPYTLTLGGATAFSDWNGTSATDTSSGYTSLTGYTQITINGTNANREWQTLNVMLYVVESSTNKEPTQVTYSGGYASDSKQLLEFNFKCDNTRPVMRDSLLNNAPAVVNVPLGKSVSVNLNNYFMDADDGNAITTSTHAVLGVKVPEYEFVQVDKYGEVVSAANKGGAKDGKSYYNIGNNDLGNTLTTAMSTVATGFDPKIAAMTADAEAFVQYGYSGITLTFTGLRSSYSQYDKNRTTRTAYTGGTTTTPTGSASVENAGHFYLLIQIRDNNETGDSGIYLPIALTVGGSADEEGKPKSTGGTLHAYSGQGSPVATKPTADGNTDDEFYFTPMAINIGGTLKAVGEYERAGELTSEELQPLAIDGDNYAKDTGVAAWSGKLNEFLTLAGASDDAIKASIYESIGTNSQQYVTVELIDIYVPQSYFGGRVVNGVGAVAGANTITDKLSDGGERDGVKYYTTKGLKLKLKSTTMNRYITASVSVEDSAANAVSIDIAIRVSNRSPEVLASKDIVTPKTGAYTGVEYEYAKAETGAYIPTIKYTVPAKSTFIITPYDLIRDVDMEDAHGKALMNVAGGFTLNGLSGVYNDHRFIAGKSTSEDGYGSGRDVKGMFAADEYGKDNAGYLQALKAMVFAADTTRSIKKTTKGNSFAEAGETDASMYNDKLFFMRRDYNGTSDGYTFDPITNGSTDFYTEQRNTTGYIECEYGNYVDIDGTVARLDFVLVYAKARTSVAAEIDLIVRDRHGVAAGGVGTQIKIVIEVVNTAPEMKKQPAEKLAVNPVMGVNDKGEPVAIVPNETTIEATYVMSDNDGDVVSYITSLGVIVANTPDLIDKYKGATSWDGVDSAYLTDGAGHKLSEYYVTAAYSGLSIKVTALNSTKAIEGGVYVYFFATDKKANGEAMGYIQIEVENTLPEMNRSETGFEEGNLWKVTSTSTADITRTRYIVGSASAYEKVVSGLDAVAADVKQIADDADSLQSGVMLSPRGSNNGYRNLDKVLKDYAKAVPDYARDTNGIPSDGESGYAIGAYIRAKSGDGYTKKEVPGNFTLKLYYYIINGESGKWYERSELITALNGEGGAKLEALCFDTEGRWSVVDWALSMTATTSFESGEELALEFSLRDEAKYGGDTAGLETAYDTERSKPRVAVNGQPAQTPTVYLSISGTGISTKDMYAQYNDYYVVEVYTENANKEGKTVTYVSTYDGSEESEYEATDNAKNIAYNKIQVGEGESIKDVKQLATDGTELIKAAGTGIADGTKAGTDSGAVYAKGKTYGKAYKYPERIVIPGTSNATAPSGTVVYVPMSFFGMLETFVAPNSQTGAVEYDPSYVGYDVRTEADDAEYDKGKIGDIAAAITLSDGKRMWTGDKLNDNPYVKIGAIDRTAEKDGSEYFTRKDSIAYYNRCIATNTIGTDGYLMGYEEYKDNRKSFVGNGEIMYLEDQARELKEHNFGLTFEKNAMRTTEDLTLTIKLAKSTGNKTAVYNKVGDSKVEQENNFRTVSVKIRVENGMFDLVEDGKTVKYDEEKGTYYVDVQMKTDGTNTFALVRDGHEDGDELTSNEITNATKLHYTDTDYGAASEYGGVYRDYAYFAEGSLGKVESWDGARTREYESAGEGQYKLTNTTPTDKAQKSMLNYYGKPTADKMPEVDARYQPNPGKYGANNGEAGRGVSGYGSYFSATALGRTLTLTPIRKTYINEDALKEIVSSEDDFKAYYNESAWATDAYGGLTQEELTKIYASRGLVVVYNYPNATEKVTSGSIRSVYYPLKIIAYDSVLDGKVGFSEGSYAALEFRVEIVNKDAELRKDLLTQEDGKYYYDILLSVGSSTEVNLYNFVSDPDIYVIGGGEVTLATRAQFLAQTGITKETADYLDSMFAYTAIVDATGSTDAGNNVEVQDGFSMNRSKYYDVTMSMRTNVGVLTPTTQPQSNHLVFAVNRRTTDSDGNDIKVFKFTTKFRDNHGKFTDEVIFRVTVTNQAPWVETDVRELTMRSGDSFTLLTSYYDTFIGGVTGGSSAYNNSKTKSLWATERRENKDTDQKEDLDGDGTSGWDFKNITSDKWKNVRTDTSKESGDGIHLGFIGVGNDDTAWKLRIQYPLINLPTDVFKIAYVNRLAVEGVRSEDIWPTAITVTASHAIEKYDFKITFIDGEGKEQNYTIRITVVSNAPIALDANDENDAEILKSAGLEGAKSEGEYIAGTYNMFVKPYSDEDVTITGFDGVKKAKHKTEIYTSNVAKDLDSGETENMTFYNGGGFSVENVVLSRDALTGTYHAPYFDIDVAGTNKSFTLTCTGYNPDKDYETLTFQIGDPGDSAKYVNITIRVYTVYANVTNETVAGYDKAAYGKYLNGGNVVNVKSADKYNGNGEYEGDESVMGKPSVYAYMAFDGLKGNDGNNTSPIKDPDVKKADSQTYAVNMYAFITSDGEKLTAEQLEPLFTVDKATNTFLLKDKNGSAGAGLGNVTDYLIGGVDSNGKSISITANAVLRLALVRSYVDFGFDQYGTSVLFSPKTATLKAEMLLYIEIQKPLGSRLNKREGGIISGGTLFMLHVEDSAPVAVNRSGKEDYDVAVAGAKGDYVKLKIFDPDNGGGTLFTDTDVGDVVTIAGFDKAGDDDYKKALSRALKEDSALDWGIDADKGKPNRAFGIEINNGDAAVRTTDAPKDVNDRNYNDDRYILEPHTLRITIDRRMDKIVNGTYLNEVTFPIVLEGRDTTPDSKGADIVIMLTVRNTEISAVDEYEEYDDKSGTGYTFGADEDAGMYVIDAKVAPHSSITVKLNDIIADEDYTVGGDTDSYMYVNGVDRKPYLYLTDEEITIKHYTNIDYDEGDDLATVKPEQGKDKYHMTGFTITAISAARAKTATFYIRVIDRAGNADAKIGDYMYREGVWIKVNVTLLNARPSVIQGVQDKPITLIGSSKKEITYGPFSIGDYVTDENDTDVVGEEASELNPDTYLRISSTGYEPYDVLYSTVGKTAVGGGESGGVNKMSSALFELTPASGGYNQTFTITTRIGYYGMGAFNLVVSDGNSNVRDDTLSLLFTLQVEIVYDPDELPTLNGVTLAACKTTTVTIESLIPELENVLEEVEKEEEEDKQEQDKVEEQVLNSKRRNAGKFEPSRDYILLSVVPSESASAYVEIEHEEGSFAWTLRALKLTTAEPQKINVTYALKSDPGLVYENSFLLTVLENKRPELIYNEITFIRYVEGVEADAFMLNTSNTAYIRADQILKDPENDVMRFDSVKSQKPSLIAVALSENKEVISITFNARGSAQITVSVVDETGEAASRTFVVINDDLPQPSLWMRITSSFESNKVMWAVIIGAVLLLIIILIIIIAVNRKKKHEREELEALLVSEMEIEEQMYRLAGGPSPTGFESFGYLPPTPGQAPDPGMMLGAGSEQPAPNPGLALGAGQGDGAQQGVAPEQNVAQAQQPQQQQGDGFDSSEF
ncbi:MAG: hypothetical protein J1G04_02940 [Clostridiales bacterium]|nr:hypothetical protein [Clostridiales bacterium]